MNLTHLRLDSVLGPVAGAHFERDLEQIRERVLEDKLPPQNGFTLIPQNGEADPAFNVYTHRMAEFIGLAKVISDYADDLPMVDVTGREYTYKIKTFGCAYQYSRKEMMQASRGLNISEKKPRAARRAIEQKFNQIMWYGDPSSGLFGLLNFPYIPRYAVTVAFNGTANPEDILAEMNAIINAPGQLTDTVAEPNFVGMAPEDYDYVKSTPLGSGSDTTILQHFLNTNPNVQVESVRELRAAGPSGGNVITVYRRTEDSVCHKLAEPFTQLEPQRRNMAVVTNCVASSGGVVSDYPLEMVIAEMPA